MSEYLPPMRYRVSAAEDGLPLKSIVRGKMGVSRRLMTRLKASEQGLTINGVRAWASDIVRAGDLVEVRMEREAPDNIAPEPLPLDILYEDGDLLAVAKPAGMIVHPTRGHYGGTLANAVIHHWRSKGESFGFHPVHRLDRDTSGVLLIAKNPFAHQQIARQLERGEVIKTYAAFVHGNPVPPEGTVSAPIGRDPVNPNLRAVKEDGSPAVTRYETVRTWREAAQLRIRLETGRTHQIRVHMKHIGCPLIGDAMYGPDEMTEARTRIHALLSRQALHAEELVFVHPVSRSLLRLTAPLPEDLVRLAQQIEGMDRRKE